MAVGLSTTNVANAMLNGLRNTSFSVAATYCQIHTGDPGASGTASISVGSTTRPSVTFSAASLGAIALTGTAPAWTNGGTSETISHVSVWSAATGGNFLWSAALTSGKSWASGDSLSLTSLGLALSPVAA